MSPPALPPPAPRPSPPAPPDPTGDAQGAAPAPVAGWSDCPRCGEHWAPASPYCDNCGWVPGSAVADAPDAPHDALAAGQASSPGLRPGTAAALAGLAAAAAVVAVWIGVGKAPAPAPAAPAAVADGASAGAAAGAGSAQAGAPAAAATSVEPALARASAPLVASPVAPPVASPVASAGAPAVQPDAALAAASAVVPRAAASAALLVAAASKPAPPPVGTGAGTSVGRAAAATARTPASGPLPAAAGAAGPAPGTAMPPELERFARTWLAEEAAADAERLDRLRPLYADRLAYRGRADADWAVVAADKAGYLRRWPQRQYQLQALRVLGPADDGSLRVALQVRWQLENQGRWRRGDSVTVLSLRRIGGEWRIVGEAGT